MEEKWVEKMNDEKWIEKMNKQEMCENWCFVCKDGGGSLFICEFKNCLKAYHAECVGKVELFFKSGGHFTCKCHSCFNCRKSSKYHCYCCPKAVCQKCTVDIVFAKLRGTRGFCVDCLKVLLLGEEQKEAGSEGNKMDLKDGSAHESLLYKYWQKLKVEENLSLKDLHSTDEMLKRGDIHTTLSNGSGSDTHGNDNLASAFNEEGIGSEQNLDLQAQKWKRSEGRISLKKRKVKSKKIEFVGWGSKPLIDFLVSIGEDTSKEISQMNVTSIICRYINDNRLLDAEKKRKTVCDKKLSALFGKKSFKKNKVYELLEPHYRENEEFHENDQQGYSSEEKSENDNSLLASKKQKKTDNLKETQEKVVIEAPRSCFASIVAENIKLVYLTRCVVIELLEEPETFESRMIGSFVKVKTDPADYMQENRYQLVQVTGVKNTSPGMRREDVLLQVSNRLNDFSITMLSDANFSEEECEDLSDRVKSGQMRKLTIVEIEEKARSLHRVIMKHWIERELALLQNQIDCANEKGRRAELLEYMERRELLKTKAEQMRLMEEVPEVIAEVIAIEPIPDDAKEKLKLGDENPPKSILNANSDTLGYHWGDKIYSSGDKAVAVDDSLTGNTGSISASYGNLTTNGDEAPRHIQDSNIEEAVGNDQSSAIQISEPRRCRSQKQSQSEDVKQKSGTEAVVIELSSDDDNGGDNSRSSIQEETEDLSEQLWYILGPREIVGPCTVTMMKLWVRIYAGASKYKVWKAGETEANAITLRRAVSQFNRWEAKNAKKA